MVNIGREAQWETRMREISDRVSRNTSIFMIRKCSDSVDIRMEERTLTANATLP